MSLTLLSGKILPPIGFGTNTGLANEEIEKAIDAAIEVGYRHIDTAFVYKNEKIVGRVLKKWFESGKLSREDIFITTKLPFGGMYPEGVEKYLKESLANLQLDFVDLYLIHFPVGFKNQEGNILPPVDSNGYAILTPKIDHRGIWEKMEGQVLAKRTRYIGLANYNVNQIETILERAKIRPSCLQIEYHLYLQQRHFVDFCRKNDMVVVASSPLGSPDHNRKMTRFLPTYKTRETLDLFEDPVVEAIAKRHSKSASQIMLRFLIQDGVVPIPRSINREHIKENFEIFDFVLDSGEMGALKGLNVGEEARITTVKNFFVGVEFHVDYPW